MELPHYTMLIQWSDEDRAFVVSLPEWEGLVSNPVTHGDSYEDAARNGVDALAALTAAIVKSGDPLPRLDVPQGIPSPL